MSSLVAGDEFNSLTAPATERKPLGPGAVLAIWVILTILLNAAIWVTGFVPSELNQAVDQGAARAEISRVGEVGDDVVRKAIHLQRDTLPFWTMLARLGDFVFEPLFLMGRAIAIATVFAALAALTGRPIGFTEGFRAASLAQGYWVLSLAVKVVLTIALRRSDVETSLALLLPPGTHHAALVVAIRQLDPFVMLGWFSLAWGGWRRHQVNLFMALFVCMMLATGETGLRLITSVVMGAGMRLSILPR